MRMITSPTQTSVLLQLVLLLFCMSLTKHLIRHTCTRQHCVWLGRHLIVLLARTSLSCHLEITLFGPVLIRLLRLRLFLPAH